MKIVRHKVKDAYQSRIDEQYSYTSAENLTDGNIKALEALKLL